MSSSSVIFIIINVNRKNLDGICLVNNIFYVNGFLFNGSSNFVGQLNFGSVDWFFEEAVKTVKFPLLFHLEALREIGGKS